MYLRRYRLRPRILNDSHTDFSKYSQKVFCNMKNISELLERLSFFDKYRQQLQLVIGHKRGIGHIERLIWKWHEEKKQDYHISVKTWFDQTKLFCHQMRNFRTLKLSFRNFDLLQMCFILVMIQYFFAFCSFRQITKYLVNEAQSKCEISMLELCLYQ